MHALCLPRRAAWLLALALVLLTTLGRAATAQPAPPVRRPNIVFFLADDHGYRDSGCYGNPSVRTPNIDRLATQGTRFTQTFVASPSGSPSRAALYTGLMPARNGCVVNHGTTAGGFKTLPGVMRELGYRVALVGKLDARPENDFPFEQIRFEEVDRAFAASVDGRPLFLMVCPPEPDVRWKENDGYDPAQVTLPAFSLDTPATRQALTRYYTSITAADTLLGQYMALIERYGLENRTVLIYSSDNGAQWPHAKWNLYNAGTRIPFIVRWPPKVQAGGISDAMISFVDLFPTLAEIGGGTPPANLDGRSFLPVLTGETREHRALIFTTHEQDGTTNWFPCRAVQTRTQKYILNLYPERDYSSPITRGMAGDGRDYWDSWLELSKTDPAAARLLEQDLDRPVEEFYDLSLDPHELKNLAGNNANLAPMEAMRRLLFDWLKEQNDQIAAQAAARRR